MKDFNRNFQTFKTQATVPQTHNLFGVPLYFFVQLFVLLIFMFLLILQNVRFQIVEKDIFDQVKKKRKLEETILPLRLELRNLTRNEILEELAEKKFFLKPPKEEQLIQMEYIK